MRIAASFAVSLCLTVACLGQEQPRTPTPAPSPTHVAIGDSIPTEPAFVDRRDPQKALNAWTSWHPSGSFGLVPLTSFQDFGALDPQLGKPHKTTDLYIVHIVDSVQVPVDALNPNGDDKVNIETSNWFYYQPEADGYFHQILKRDNKQPPAAPGLATGALPPLHHFTNGYVISISRMKVDPNATPIPPKPAPDTGLGQPEQRPNSSSSRSEVDPDLGIPAQAGPLDQDMQPSTPAPDLTYAIVPTLGTPANVTALVALFGAVVNVSVPAPGATAHVVPEDAKTPPVYYNYKFQVIPISNKPLKPPYTVAFTATAATDAEGTGTCHNVTKATTCPMAQTVSVLDVEHWNVGINIVAFGPVEQKWGLDDTNKVTMSSTRHMPLYATFDYSPWASKCSMTNSRCVYLQGGVPLSGAVLHMPYAGVAWPIPYVNKFIPLSLYGGITFMKQTKLTGLPVGTATTPDAFQTASTTDWAKKPLYGIEVPISAIVSKIKSSVAK
jgi:hypothetical protein